MKENIVNIIVIVTLLAVVAKTVTVLVEKRINRKVTITDLLPNQSKSNSETDHEPIINNPHQLSAISRSEEESNDAVEVTKENAFDILLNAEEKYRLANQAFSVKDFLENWDQMTEMLKSIVQFEDTVEFFELKPSTLLVSRNREFQLKLQTAIRRQADLTIANMKSCSNKEKEERYRRFCDRMRQYRTIYSEETKNAINSCANDVFAAAGRPRGKETLFK